MIRCVSFQAFGGTKLHMEALQDIQALRQHMSSFQCNINIKDKVFVHLVLHTMNIGWGGDMEMLRFSDQNGRWFVVART